MPFLRVIRDKRGYETTYLMDWYQEHGRQRSRVLYAFRGPGGVRVGRLPLEPATMREVEAHHPQVAFDWKAIFADKQVIEASPELRRRRPRRDEVSAPAVAPEPVRAAAPKVEPEAVPRPPAVPSVITGDTVEARLDFLSAWYPVVRTRVERRTTDETRRLALLALAERLNPDAFPAETDPADSLAQAAEALDRLSRVLTRRRRRAGRKRTGSDEGGVVGSGPSDVPTEAPDEASADDGAAEDEQE